MAGLRLGEDVAIAMLQDLVNTLTEDFVGFHFTRLDGTPVDICKDGQPIVVENVERFRQDNHALAKAKMLRGFYKT